MTSTNRPKNRLKRLSDLLDGLSSARAKVVSGDVETKDVKVPTDGAIFLFRLKMPKEFSLSDKVSFVYFCGEDEADAFQQAQEFLRNIERLIQPELPFNDERHGV